MFVDPAAPADEPIVWQGSWRTLKPVYEFAPRTGNFAEAWNGIAFPRLLFNTAFIAFTEQFATSVSTLTDAQVARLLESASEDEVYGFVNALYVLDMSRRLDLVVGRILL